MNDEIAAARPLLTGLDITAVERLRGGESSSVHRVRATLPGDEPTSVIVKQFLDAGEGWVREAAALSVLPAGTASGLVAEHGAPPIVVTRDLGAGPSLADVLLGADPDAAAAAVRRWAQAVAQLHGAAFSLRREFGAALEARQGDLPVRQSRVAGELADAARALDDRCAFLGVTVPRGALDELRELGHRLGSSGAASISPADTCPDNNVLVGDRLVLIDFEGAQWRHVTWDVAYLRVPWPTCWCSWRIPADVADDAVAAYRAAAEAVIPEVADDQFERDLDAATVGWAFTSTTWFLDNALGADPGNPDRPTPTRRAMILHRLRVAAASSELPALAELAGRLGSELRTRWGAVELELAPAFHGRP